MENNSNFEENDSVKKVKYERENFRWFKVDVHHHTYEDDRVLSKERSKKLINYQEIIEYFYKNNGRLLAITNHNEICIESIKKYRKYISDKKYDITVLPGVEINYYLAENDEKNHQDKKESRNLHILLIFPEDLIPSSEEMEFEDNEKINNINKKINDCIKETKEKHSSIKHPKQKFIEKDEFFSLINSIQKLKINFLLIPHGDKKKGLKYVNIQTASKELEMLYFNYIESKFRELNTIKYKELEAILFKMSLNETNIIMGTDAHNFNEFKTNLVNCPWFYTKNNFEGLVYGSFFKEKIKFLKDKPYITNRFIKTIKFDSNKMIHLYPGTNLIIGEKGEGKSLLLNSIFKKLDPEELQKNTLDNRYKPYENIKFEIEIEHQGAEFTDGEIFYFKQGFINYNEKLLYDKMNQIFDKLKNKIYYELIEKLFSFKKNIEDFYSNKQAFFSTFTKYIQIKKENLLNNYENKKKKLEQYFENYITYLSNEETIKELESDIKFMDETKQRYDERKYKSNWLEKYLELLLDNLTNIHDNDLRYKKNEVLTKLIENIRKKSTPSKDETLARDLISTQNKFTELRNKLLEIPDNYCNNIKNMIKLLRKGISRDESDPIANEFSSSLLLKDDEKFKNDEDFKNIFFEFISSITKENNKKEEQESYLDILNNNKNLNFLIKESTIKDKLISTIENNFCYDIYHNNEKLTNKSFGEKQKIVLENILNKEIENKKLLLFDQPEDNLDNIAICQLIIESIIAKKHVDVQIIIITHDPKIILNSSAYSIINAKKISENKFEYVNLNYIDIVKKDKGKFIKLLDGKKRFPYYRYLFYISNEKKLVNKDKTNKKINNLIDNNLTKEILENDKDNK